MFISPSTKSRNPMCVQSSIVSTGWNAELYDEPRIVARITTPDRKVALVAPSTRSLSLTSSKRTDKLIKWYQTNSHLENRLERWNYAGVTPQAPTDCSQTTTHLLSRGCLIAISWGFTSRKSHKSQRESIPKIRAIVLTLLNSDSARTLKKRTNKKHVCFA